MRFPFESARIQPSMEKFIFAYYMMERNAAMLYMYPKYCKNFVGPKYAKAHETYSVCQSIRQVFIVRGICKFGMQWFEF